MGSQEIRTLILVVTAIFLIAPVFIVVYILVYNQRKKRHIEEKAQMKLIFEAELIKTQMEIQEQTMQTIGVELHDNIGQLLSLTSLTLNSIELENVDKAQQKIDAAIELNLKSIKEMRLLGKLLHGEQLVKLGLEEAIRNEIAWIEKSGKFTVIYDIDGERPAESNTDKDLILFRIVQEIFNNIIKHSQAKQIDIRLTYRADSISLQVIDDGDGFDIDALTEEQKGMGLKNIQKRAEIVGGEVFIRSQPGQGACIEIIIPYP
ncbi:MAG TPA: ATP-binding protein [Mucilaginibacter sp.]|nr:ATP-binding protein [Mucilaginibacter sp.]